MKNFFVFLIISLVSMNMVSAIGIVWSTEGEYVDENSDKCITYGTYNPSSNDIKSRIEVTGSLGEVIIGASTEEKIIKAHTPPTDAEQIDFCFKVPSVYKKDCIIGDVLCEQRCEEETKSFKGEIIMTEEPLDSSGGTGSGATVSASAPLTLVVNCVEYERDWSLAYVVGIVIVLVLLGILLYNEYSTPKLVRDEERLKRLRAKIKSEKGKK